jgi:hypothetical protein
MELSLLGEFATVPEGLFKYRLPDEAKNEAGQLTDICVEDGTNEQMTQPWSFLARDLLKVVAESDLGPRTTLDISKDFVTTLSQGHSWGRAILAERALPPLPGWAARRAISAALASRPVSRTMQGIMRRARGVRKRIRDKR